MITRRKHVSPITLENDETYFKYIEALIVSIDVRADLIIIRKSESISFRITPSDPKYVDILIDEINKYHNMIGFKLEYSKSIKKNNIINFDVSIIS